MRLKTLLLLLSVFAFFSSLAQTPKEIISLDYRVLKFIEGIDKEYSEGRRSELAQLVLELDTAGKVKNIHIMGTETDTLYKMLTQMRPADFNDWKAAKWRNKTLIVPYFYLSDAPKDSDYIYKLLIGYKGGKPLVRIVFESPQIVIVNYLVWYMPSKPDVMTNTIR